MVATGHARELFNDALSLHASALERLDAGDIRDAAEKAWCATKRATDALILARTGNLPNIPSQTSRELRVLARNDERVQPLRTRYSLCIHELHSECFYNDHCDPEEFVEELIRDTVTYIEDAESLA